MSKILKTLLILAVTVAMASCSSESTTDNGKSPEESQTQSQSPSQTPSSSTNQDSKATAMQLANQLSSAGIGCDDANLQDTPILFDGERIDCTIDGAEFRIEVYPSNQFQDMVAYLIENGFGSLQALTDGATWICSGSSTVLEIAKEVLGGSITTLDEI